MQQQIIREDYENSMNTEIDKMDGIDFEYEGDMSADVALNPNHSTLPPSRIFPLLEVFCGSASPARMFKPLSVLRAPIALTPPCLTGAQPFASYGICSTLATWGSNILFALALFKARRLLMQGTGTTSDTDPAVAIWSCSPNAPSSGPPVPRPWSAKAPRKPNLLPLTNV